MKSWRWYNEISMQRGLTEDFIREHKKQLNWDSISQYQTLSEAFIKEMSTYVKWNLIAKYQTLSEDFIEMYFDLLDQENIFRYQNLSYAFLKKHQHVECFWLYLSANKYLTEEMMEGLIGLKSNPIHGLQKSLQTMVERIGKKKKNVSWNRQEQERIKIKATKIKKKVLQNTFFFSVV